METILISGGTGIIGQHLSKKLIEKGYTVTLLSRTHDFSSGIKKYGWNIEKNEIEQGAIEKADYIIHLAGAGIANHRWTRKRRQLIIDSRVKTGQLIFDKVKNSKTNLKAFITASAIGYYGTNTLDTVFSETDPPSNDFLGEVSKLWEQTAGNFEKIGIRTVKIRTAVVLSPHGGALGNLIKPVKLGIGSAIGNGKQYLPWIHLDDLCGIYIKAIEDTQMEGAYNAVAPDHTTNSNFMATLARVLKKPFWVPNIPAIMLRLILGKRSVILLNGNDISSNKIIKAGYKFKFPGLETALIDLLTKNRL